MIVDRTPNPHRYGPSGCTGFTLIELMIVIAIIAIILTLALPVYSNYTTRTKMDEALSTANATKVAVAAMCHDNPALTDIDNDVIAYAFEGTEYVQSIQVSGSCAEAVITMTTRNTGQSPAPVLTLTGQFDSGTSVILWTCDSDNTASYLLPTACRNS